MEIVIYFVQYQLHTEVVSCGLKGGGVIPFMTEVGTDQMKLK